MRDDFGVWGKSIIRKAFPAREKQRFWPRVLKEKCDLIEKKLMLARCARDDDSRAVFNTEIRDVER